MTIFRAIFLFTGLLQFGCEVLGDSDLLSALDAIDRRQRELAEYDEQQDYPYDLGEVAFLNNAPGFDKDYLDEDNYDSYNKRLTSSFRERQEEDRKKQMEELARKIFNDGRDDLPTSYGYYSRSPYMRTLVEGDRYYPMGDNSGFRKRGRFIDFDEEPFYSQIHHHVPRNELRSGSKRFRVAKRSNSYNKDQKRSVKKQTDPQVEKELSSIFGVEDNKLGDGATTTLKPVENTPPPRKIEKKDKPKMDLSKDSTDLNKEVFSPVAPQNKKTLQLKKKSIDWSDYFGLDRRKKSENNGLDNEWLMERYHKAVAITAKKRNAELPVQTLRNHGKEDEKLEEMDKKLEKLEDEIVEDALKYTGAHQEEGDSKKIQQTKDNIISQLAQAYNIEKLRNALEEYRIEVEKARKEVEKAKQDEKLIPESFLEEKRVSVPRKEAIDDSRDTIEADNSIKCTDSEDCHEQKYKIPSDVIELHFTDIGCPAIQRACNDIASMIGYYGHVFDSACRIHQMCLLCSNNSWFSPTRQCNTLYLTKAFELCSGKDECKKEARRSVKYLLDINKSLQAQAALTDQCELMCPDNGVLSK